jgi:hypothetical protein
LVRMLAAMEAQGDSWRPSDFDFKGWDIEKIATPSRESSAASNRQASGQSNRTSGGGNIMQSIENQSSREGSLVSNQSQSQPSRPVQQQQAQVRQPSFGAPSFGAPSQAGTGFGQAGQYFNPATNSFVNPASQQQGQPFLNQAPPFIDPNAFANQQALFVQQQQQILALQQQVANQQQYQTQSSALSGGSLTPRPSFAPKEEPMFRQSRYDTRPPRRPLNQQAWLDEEERKDPRPSRSRRHVEDDEEDEDEFPSFRESRRDPARAQRRLEQKRARDREISDDLLRERPEDFDFDQALKKGSVLDPTTPSKSLAMAGLNIQSMEDTLADPTYDPNNPSQTARSNVTRGVSSQPRSQGGRQQSLPPVPMGQRQPSQPLSQRGSQAPSQRGSQPPAPQ